MNLIHYLNTVSRLWNTGDGSAVSKFLSLNGNHVPNRNLHVEDAENLIIRQVRPPLDEVVNTHLKVLYYIHDTRKLLNLHNFTVMVIKLS